MAGHGQMGKANPLPDKFPSAFDGKGFKPLADYVHAKGLKFGIHVMRGIPRQAVWAKSWEQFKMCMVKPHVRAGYEKTRCTGIPEFFIGIIRFMEDEAKRLKALKS